MREVAAVGLRGGARLCRALFADARRREQASISGFNTAMGRTLARLASLRSKWGSIESRPTTSPPVPRAAFRTKLKRLVVRRLRRGRHGLELGWVGGGASVGNIHG